MGKGSFIWTKNGQLTLGCIATPSKDFKNVDELK